MDLFAKSLDGASIHYETSGKGSIALVFVHGWGGSSRWWDQQRDAFSKNYQIVQMDLAGHGKSSLRSGEWSVQAYAQDIKAVIEALKLDQVILIGHSMSGSNVVQAYDLLKEKVKMIVLVDTLQDLDHMPSMNDAAPFFAGMQMAFKPTIEMALPQYMFAKTSPQAVVQRVVKEISHGQPSTLIASLKPFYATDIRNDCSKVKVPVRAINSDLFPISAENNRKYLSDFGYEVIQGVGHYPMLEAPEKFNASLQKILMDSL